MKCVILALNAMLQQKDRKVVKTDKRNDVLIARYLSHHDYPPLHNPTVQDEQTKEQIRMRDDHKLALKRVKQQILSFGLWRNYRFDDTANHWTQIHLKWLRALKSEDLYAEILQEYLLTYDNLTDKLERFEKRIEELASNETYHENVGKLSCFIGVKILTTLGVLMEVGDFKRFASARHYVPTSDLHPRKILSATIRTALKLPKLKNVMSVLCW